MLDSLTVQPTGNVALDLVAFLWSVFWNYNFLIMLVVVCGLMFMYKKIICENVNVLWLKSKLTKRLFAMVLCIFLVFLTGVYEIGKDFADQVFVFLLNVTGLFLVYHKVWRKIEKNFLNSSQGVR